MHFVRHGQSLFNQAMSGAGRDPGIIDAGLTEEGFAQSKRAAAALKGQGVEEIICSPYTRAIQTASVIADELNVPIHIEPNVGERCFYSCDIGTPKGQLAEKWGYLDFSAIENENWWPESDESHKNLARRADLFLRKWREKLQTRPMLLVSHWYFLNHLTGHDFRNGEVHFRKII